jgi:GTP-binding protein Era
VKSGLVALAGRPNVGKSTLVNALCGDKVAITSRVPNTTRRRIFGVAHGDGWQLVLVDLPGFQRPIDALTERMQETVDGSFEDVDAVLLVVSARDRIGAGDRFVARRVFSLGVPVVVAVNKIDRLKHGHVASQMKVAATLGDFHALHPVSAMTRDGIGELRQDLVYLLPEGPALFPADTTTDLPLERRVAEVIREKALHLVREEVPHAVTVVVDELTERAVRASIFVETESQKGILVGRRGATVREIGTRARPEVEALVGGHVFLELSVKVRPRWRRDPRELERLGL